jgi:hypothetical protein
MSQISFFQVYSVLITLSLIGKLKYLPNSVDDETDTVVEYKSPFADFFPGKERMPCHLSGYYLMAFAALQ